jgi:hypothetical protein
MFSGLGLGNIMGAPSSSGQGLANGYNPYGQQQAMNGTLAQHAAAYTNQLMSIHARQAEKPAEWRVAGQDMTFDEFVAAVFPDDSAERTFFLLKFSK